MAGKKGRRLAAKKRNDTIAVTNAVSNENPPYTATEVVNPVLTESEVDKIE